MNPDDRDELNGENDTEANPWARLAHHRGALEMCVEEEVPFADRAKKLLDRLDEEGY